MVCLRLRAAQPAKGGAAAGLGPLLVTRQQRLEAFDGLARQQRVAALPPHVHVGAVGVAGLPPEQPQRQHAVGVAQVVDGARVELRVVGRGGVPLVERVDLALPAARRGLAEEQLPSRALFEHVPDNLIESLRVLHLRLAAHVLERVQPVVRSARQPHGCADRLRIDADDLVGADARLRRRPVHLVLVDAAVVVDGHLGVLACALLGEGDVDGAREELGRDRLRLVDAHPEDL